MRMIDADALKDRLQSLADDDWNQGVITSWADAYHECADMVDDQPTIEPAHGTGYRDGYKRGKRAGYKKARDAGRKKGKWIRIYSRPNVLKYLGWTCSVCGTRTGEEHAPQWFKYCPNCGARMEEGGE